MVGWCWHASSEGSAAGAIQAATNFPPPNGGQAHDDFRSDGPPAATGAYSLSASKAPSRRRSASSARSSPRARCREARSLSCDDSASHIRTVSSLAIVAARRVASSSRRASLRRRLYLPLERADPTDSDPEQDARCSGAVVFAGHWPNVRTGPDRTHVRLHREGRVSEFPPRPRSFLTVRVEDASCDYPLLGLCAGYERGHSVHAIQ